jgi:predicted HicB family RNase H-like nuclease
MDAQERRTIRGGPEDNLIEYKGYLGRVEFDNEAGIFHGEVINLRDVITFQGICVDELRQAFIDSIEDYLEFCAERGEQAEKPFSGKFLARVGPELHREISLKAKMENVSLNQWVRKQLEEALTPTVSIVRGRQNHSR